MAIIGFIFGLVALARVEKSKKTLKDKGILEENHKQE